MLLLPFLPILMVAIIGNVSSEEALSIPLLADFGTTILGPVITYCRNQNAKINGLENYSILCASANALNKIFFDFSQIIMQEMNIGTDGYETGHTIFTAIHNQTHIKKDVRLEKQKVNPLLIYSYHEFVTKVGEQIVGIMTGHLHAHLADRFMNQYNARILSGELDKEIEEMYKNAKMKQQKIQKLKLLKNLFLTKVNALETSNNEPKSIIVHTYSMQHVATEICKNFIKGEDAEKQLAFFLDLFVANMQYIEDFFPGYLHLAYKWKMRTLMEK